MGFPIVEARGARCEWAFPMSLVQLDGLRLCLGLYLGLKKQMHLEFGDPVKVNGIHERA